MTPEPSSPHISVLLDEVLAALMPDGRAPRRLLDGTLGAGGHTLALLERGTESALGLDLDPQALGIARARLAPYVEQGRAHIVQASYLQLAEQAQALAWDWADAILLDLGVSSMQLDTPERGFAFRFSAPLDMRFADDGRPSAADLLNHWDEAELSQIFWRYGEEKFSRPIARAIVANRPLHSTTQLAELVSATVPKVRAKDRRPDSKSIHPATRIFQALRIAVNDELQVLERSLPQALNLLSSGGRLAVISFHSLEDAIVKHCFKEASESFTAPPGMASLGSKQARIKLITRKPLEASPAEAQANPRARSAKLRVVEKL
jgi:16S rRNA (cytosine1402-N4)-methyltransferase